MIFYKDHSPPHFHAKYNNSMGMFSIETLTMIEGNLSKRVQALVLEWANLHKEELEKDWNLAQNGSRLDRIEPLV